MIEFLTSLFSDHPKVLILGFGKEGKSTYGFIRKHFPNLKLGIADSNIEIENDEGLSNDGNLELFTGSSYLESLNQFDIIIKSPGVNISNVTSKFTGVITSQTDLFLRYYSNQVIGVTGTKGKSTTVSLIKHFLDATNVDSLLLGNIGVPAFDMIEAIKSDTVIVYELSAHQLEYLMKSPHVAVLLNIFPEHLDYFKTYNDYQIAKLNICKFQEKDNCLIVNDSLANKLPHRRQRIIVIPNGDTKLEIDNIPLAGEHNLINIEAALAAVEEVGIDRAVAIKSLANFRGLPHRLEDIGMFGGIRFVNDSISTIPESTIAAIKAIKNIDTLLLGGWDRGLDYSELVDFLLTSKVSNFIFLGKAGDRMYDIFNANNDKNLFKVDSLANAFEIIIKQTKKGSICLLSPAAASYDQFHNFEHRGDTFRSLASKL